MSAKLGKGLGMPGWRIKDQIAGLSSEAKEFAIYLDCYEPGICKFMADHGYTASDLYHQMIDSFRKMASGKNLSGHEANLLAIHVYLLQRPELKRSSYAVYSRLLVAGALFSAQSLGHKSRLENWNALHEIFPSSKHEGVRFWFASIAAEKRALVQKAKNTGAEKSKTAKSVIYEQWEKFNGDKATAATFATYMSEGKDDSAKPEAWLDVITREKLSPGPVARKTVARWINQKYFPKKK